MENISDNKKDRNSKLPIVPKQYRVHFIMLISCFVLWGLLNNMTDNLVPAFGRIFMLEAANASMTQVAFYGSYAVLALPAAILIKKYSYRTGVLVGLGLYIIGAMVIFLQLCYRILIYFYYQYLCWQGGFLY